MLKPKSFASVVIMLSLLEVAQAQNCARFISNDIDRALVKTESSFNPFAIGVVKGHLKWQPRNKEEAIATASALKAAGYNFSMGCRQVNLFNLWKYGLDLESVFDSEKNSKTGATIYNECLRRARSRFGDGDAATRAALSCYYSGNFTTGQRKEDGKQSYVDKVLTNLAPGERSASLAIPVISTKSPGRKTGTDKTGSTSHAHEPIQRAAEAKPDDWDVFNEF